MTSVAPPPIPPTPDDHEFDGGRPMTILEHLLELRTRLIRCAVGVVIGVSLAFAFTNRVLDFLLDQARDQAPSVRFIYSAPLENFTTYFTVSLYLGLMFAMPVLVYETLGFVLPGLTPQEKRWVLPLVIGIFFSFAVGVAFNFYVTLPRANDFLLNFNTQLAEPYINIGKYISFATRLLFFAGLTFELPLFMLALAKFGVVTGRKLLAWWRYIIVVVFVVAAVVTPTPDPITQTFVAGPLLLLYFVGVGLAFLFGRKPATPAT